MKNHTKEKRSKQYYPFYPHQEEDDLEELSFPIEENEPLSFPEENLPLSD